MLACLRPLAGVQALQALCQAAHAAMKSCCGRVTSRLIMTVPPLARPSKLTSQTCCRSGEKSQELKGLSELSDDSDIELDKQNVLILGPTGAPAQQHRPGGSVPGSFAPHSHL